LRKELEGVRVPVAGSIKPQLNKYYLRVSRRYMVAGILLMVTLVLYIMGVMAFFGDYVTYDNLKYLSRDFSAVSFSGSAGFSSVVYNGRENVKFEYFRGGVAMVNGDTLTYYDPSGIPLIDEKINYSDPVIVSGNKYMLVYDLGGEEYSIYNQLTKIIGKEAEGRIVTCDIATDGASVIVTRSKETKYVVTLYNAAFNKSMSIYKDNYVMDAAISPDGKRVVICSAVPSESDFSCEIDICAAGKSESVRVLTYEHTMPLDVYAAKDGFVLLCDRGIYFYDYEGKSIGSHTFDGMSLRYADINEKSAAIVGSTNALGNEARLLVFNLSGEKICDRVIGERVAAVYAGRDTKTAAAYLKTSNNVLSVGPGGEELLFDAENAGEIVSAVPVSGGAIVCRRSGAQFYSHDSGTDK
jgi:hypothetical protein